ncbi:MAG: methylmalonyl-CoA carboxyltransferase [Christensenellaceae bacterium]|nr:methylmalonyl-CoA carboxyltransferase [Christensenellaceae bacterium]
MSNISSFEKILDEKKKLLLNDEIRQKKQKELGKMTAEERVKQLLDAGSFVEMYALMSKNNEAAGVLTGYGTVNSRPVYVLAQDFTVYGGAIGKVQSKKICKLLKTALETGAPVVSILDSAGVKLDEGIKALNAYADIFKSFTDLKGFCPTISIISGPCLGGASIISQLTDISIMVKDIANLTMYGPTVISALYDKDYSMEDIAGADFVAKKGGCTYVANNEIEAFAATKNLLSMLPDSSLDLPPKNENVDLNKLLPNIEINDAYNIINAISDHVGFELYSNYETTIRTILAKVGGISVALIVNNAVALSGLISAGAMKKASKFVRFADNFNIPVVSIVNTDGLEIPDACEQVKLIEAQADLLLAYTEASVPKVSLIIGNAIGQAYVAMASKTINDMIYAWPDAIISPLEPSAAIQVVWRDKISSSELPADKVKEELIKEYIDENASALVAAKLGLVDDIIEPKYTRMYIISALEMLASKNV